MSPLAAFLLFAFGSVAGCSCSEPYVEDGGSDDGGSDDGGSDGGDAGTDGAMVEAGPDVTLPDTCGNGIADEFEVCDPAAGNVSPALRCDCDDNDSCTLDRCKAGTSAEECTCECEHIAQGSVFEVGTCNDGDSCTNDIVRCDNPSDPNDMSCANQCDIAMCDNPDIVGCVPGCGNGVLDVGESCDNSSENDAEKCPVEDDNNECTNNVCVGLVVSCTRECTFPLRTGFPYDTCDDGKACTDDSGAPNATCTGGCTNTPNASYDDLYCNMFDTVCRDFRPTLYDQNTCAVGCTYDPVAAWYTMVNAQCVSAALP